MNANAISAKMGRKCPLGPAAGKTAPGLEARKLLVRPPKETCLVVSLLCP